jgi:hypothetical protein
MVLIQLVKKSIEPILCVNPNPEKMSDALKSCSDVNAMERPNHISKKPLTTFSRKRHHGRETKTWIRVIYNDAKSDPNNTINFNVKTDDSLRNLMFDSVPTFDFFRASGIPSKLKWDII